ncbi:hypothetical protein [Vibrio parahaemolyticus]|uniref:hypothetical protein n=1 Tax=Vibrio parahaemolyticus TaxID=670 RepID=UPI0011244D72|nr:hypothetical protein [Vibrio parahaemolyticus]MBE3933232.1 hypothetical protein [Vibrio parahaemolyticus]MBE4044068.1 hypothetical protein [Vibrio parahaemolyticus]MCG6439999.1 hypothetical protein [Vibrio parahaemolyticus]MCG6454843.1 hypothetical protein [Vibrio parahaemolyticus]TOB86134.1 hypothetical protein CGJ97_23365 [Vibrio parahaemolyticus]
MEFNLSTEFWIGTGLAIPFSILASLITPKIQQWIDNRSQKSAIKRSQELRNELERIKALKDSSEKLKLYLLETIIKTAFYTAVTSALAMPLWAAGSVFYFGGILNFVGQCIALIGALLVVQVCSRAIKDLSRIRNFSEFEQQVSDYVSKPSTN